MAFSTKSPQSNIESLMTQLHQAGYPNYNDFTSLEDLGNYIQAQIASLSVFFGNTSQLPVFPEFLNNNINMDKSDDINNSDLTNYLLSNPPCNSLEAQISKMVEFFIDNYGMIRRRDLLKIRDNFTAQNQNLGPVFDALKVIYSSRQKSTEKLIKWIIKKVFMPALQTNQEHKNPDHQILSNFFCKRVCFAQKTKEQIEADIKGDQMQMDEEILFEKSGSNFKMINSQFIKQLFQSEEFQHEYDVFMDHFDEEMEKDTLKKKQNFSSFIVECIKNNKIDSINKYKRVPWTKMWSKKAKRVAVKLESQYMMEYYSKQVKFESSDLKCMTIPHLKQTL